MSTGQYSLTVSIGGVTIQKVINRTGDSSQSWDVELPAGKAVTSWVKTDANTAACVLAGGHGQTDGKFDVYWDGGVRYGVDGLITVNALALDGGAGDDFPATATTGIVVTKQVSINTTIDGDNAELFAISLESAASNSGHVDLQDSANDSIYATPLTTNEPVVFDLGAGITNPLTGDVVATTKASNGSSATAATLKILCLSDSTI